MTICITSQKDKYRTRMNTGGKLSNGQLICRFSRLVCRLSRRDLKIWKNQNQDQFQEDIKPQPPTGGHDLVGPKDEKSNIRQMVFAKRVNETAKEKQLRELQEKVHSWHLSFWTKHNEDFSQSKKKFISSRSHDSHPETGKESADELSVFYKDFLDKNLKAHMMYQRKWYSYNFQIMWLSLQVNLQRLVSKVIPRTRQE